MADTDSFWKYISWGKLSVKELGVLSFPRVPLSVFFFVFFLQVLAEVRGFTLKKKKSPDLFTFPCIRNKPELEEQT